MKTVRNLLMGLCFLGLVLLGYAMPAYAANDTPSDASAVIAESNQATALFAGGCFWCMEKPFEDLEGVISATSGYTGGTTENPNYSEVSTGVTGHVEAVQVVYDPMQLSYDELLDVFWHNVDPVDDAGQFCDQGSQYLSKIFVQSDEQLQRATQSEQRLRELPQFRNLTIATTIEPAQTFYPAEERHQNYARKHPVRYQLVELYCGRPARLNKLWG
ncbi:MAG: peptide-methionine (S)-S-oxide reductase MsrA [Kaiparowitsia implicata GSE-PSE-MK54-09C]|jgi:peptide-methionine (S)-S-oxide reductase|nr:peptide-methionine (S)-S-oxide reductase MsrA [Kaiparowitsia implicata GSE-PSE-MK54-09C]